MAEVVGIIASGITLAAMFKTCLDVIDLIQTVHHQELDLKKLVLKLSIEKCRLYAWGEAMGLTEPPRTSAPRALDSHPDHVQALVRDTLDMIAQLFIDTCKLEDRYGCRPIQPTTPTLLLTTGDHFGPVENLTASFSRFKVGGWSPEKVAQLKSRTRWVVHDRKRFTTLLAELKAFIDGLQDITLPFLSKTHQENTIRCNLQHIDDVETLDLVAEVCEIDHPNISDAASERSTIMSLAPLRQRDIEQWTSSVVTGPEAELVELESLTVTELKHRMVAYTDRGIVIGQKSDREAATMRLISVVTVLFVPATFASVSCPEAFRS